MLAELQDASNSKELCSIYKKRNEVNHAIKTDRAKERKSLRKNCRNKTKEVLWVHEENADS